MESPKLAHKGSCTFNTWTPAYLTSQAPRYRTGGLLSRGTEVNGSSFQWPNCSFALSCISGDFPFHTVVRMMVQKRGPSFHWFAPGKPGLSDSLLGQPIIVDSHSSPDSLARLQASGTIARQFFLFQEACEKDIEVRGIPWSGTQMLFPSWSSRCELSAQTPFPSGKAGTLESGRIGFPFWLYRRWPVWFPDICSFTVSPCGLKTEIVGTVG